MADNVIDFPQFDPGAHLARFDISSDPTDFLNAVEDAFRKQASLQPLKDRTSRFQSLARNSPRRGELFSKACILLAKLRFMEFQGRNDLVPAQESAEPNERAIAAAQKIHAAMRAGEDARSARTAVAANTPSAMYPPAHRYVDAIASVFGDDEPMSTVAEHLSALFPARTYRDDADCWIGSPMTSEFLSTVINEHFTSKRFWGPSRHTR